MNGGDGSMTKTYKRVTQACNPDLLSNFGDQEQQEDVQILCMANSTLEQRRFAIENQICIKARIKCDINSLEAYRAPVEQEILQIVRDILYVIHRKLWYNRPGSKPKFFRSANEYTMRFQEEVTILSIAN